MAFQLYRQTMIGDCLCEALEELVTEEKLTQELAMTILKQFDASLLDAFKQQVTGKANIKANLKNYRYFDNVWQFSLENVVFRLNASGTGSMNNAQEITCDKAKVVCVDAKLLEQS